MGKNFRRLISTVKMWVRLWYGIRHMAEIGVYIQAQYRTCKITEKVGDKIINFYKAIEF